MFVKTLKEYMDSSSFHGLRFIAQDGVHWTERVFWVTTIMLSWYYSSTLIESSWSGYQNNAISFVTDTTYKHWNTPFPSITFCETRNINRTIAATKKYWGSLKTNLSHDLNLEEILRQLSFFPGNSYFVKEYCYNSIDESYNEAMKCPLDNLAEIVEQIRATCEETFERCSWREKEFDCCKYFLPLDTEFGVCFSLNNIHINASYHPERYILDTMSNYTTGPGKISVTLLGNNSEYMVYFHAREDVPSLNTPKAQKESLTPKHPRYFWFSVLEVQNDQEVRDTSVKQRKCRFSDENFLPSFDKYGYEPCLIDCRKRYQLQFCECYIHTLPRTQPNLRCGLHGSSCVNEHFMDLSVLKNEWNHYAAKKGIKCTECIASCTEMEIHVTRRRELTLNESQTGSNFDLTLEALPTERPRRIVVRGILDLVVSMGGAAGLLVGASLLSFVEFVYFFTLRLYGNYKTAKEAPAEKRSAVISKEFVPVVAANRGLDDANLLYF